MTLPRYKIVRHEGGSAKYGPCEVCGQSADTVYRQSAELPYTEEDGSTAWTFHRAPPAVWGHKSCLLNLRVAS